MPMTTTYRSGLVMFPFPVIPTKFYSICETGGCAEFSRLIRSSISTAIDPCDNFYRFVCSTWDSQHNVSVRQAHRDQYVASLAATARAVVVAADGAPQTLRQKAALLYQSCEAVAQRHRDDTGQFRNLLAKGGLTWPQPAEKKPAFNNSDGFFFDAIVYSHFQVGFDPVFTVGKVADAIVTVQLRDVIPDWIHTRGEWKATHAYDDKLRRVCRHFSHQRGTCEAELTAFASVDDEVSRALTVLFREDNGPPLNRSQFENASSARPFDAWARVFSKLLSVALEQVQSPATRFDLKDPAFFRALNKALAKFSEDTMVLYMAWITIFNLGPLFSAELSDSMAGSAPSSTPDRIVEARCLVLMEKLLGQCMPAAFVQLNVAQEAQEDIRRITKNIDYPLNITLTQFTANGSQPARDFSKFTTRPHLFGDNGRFASVAELEQAAADALPKMSDSVLANYRQIMSFRRAHLGKVLLRTLRIGGCYAPKLDRVNYYRFYDHACRSVVVSPIAATLPIYDEQTSSGLRYGAIGSLVSEALFEAFYETRDDLSPTQREKLNSARTCIERSIFKVDTVENMEEAFLLYGGHVALWSAYRSEVYLQDRRLPGLEDYSEDMLFFIAFCLIQCGGSVMPRDTLCNIPLKSSSYFADAFTCPLGSAMNLGNRCAYV
ncbi:neprilysin-1-like [Dermacentor variabilis]|uniref:neprilysin-1-like n=1 Tax=Dermacentor variabilis TaxID=34621 RepID=UPI003F5BBC6F